jgi:RNA polymerase sigma-70 factor (ECF subfamily)
MEPVRLSKPLETSTPEADVERSWVKRAQEGDAAAFRAIFERYASGVRRFLRDLMRDDGAADEATQETFVRVHQKLSSIRETDRLSSWVFGIARNVSFEHRRRAAAAELWADDEMTDAIEAVLPSPSPEALLLDRELEGALGHALERISPDRRAALLLRIDHGLAYEEIAAAMGWSLQKVKNEIHRARLKLRVSLAQHVGGRR